MELREKKAICDICSVSLAAAVLPCAAPLFADVPTYMRMSTLIFVFAAGITAVGAVRRRLEKRPGVWLLAAAAAAFVALAALSVWMRLR